MHGFPDGLFGDFNMLSGTWVFGPQRQKEGIVHCGTQRHVSMPPTSERSGSTAQKPGERGPALNGLQLACQLRPLVGTHGPDLHP